MPLADSVSRAGDLVAAGGGRESEAAGDRAETEASDRTAAAREGLAGALSDLFIGGDPSPMLLLENRN